MQGCHRSVKTIYQRPQLSGRFGTSDCSCYCACGFADGSQTKDSTHLHLLNWDLVCRLYWEGNHANHHSACAAGLVRFTASMHGNGHGTGDGTDISCKFFRQSCDLSDSSRVLESNLQLDRYRGWNWSRLRLFTRHRTALQSQGVSATLH